MTTLLSWVSYSDTGEASHLPRAVYLASDSRITWGSADHRWEAGRKVFVAAKEPHLFGYCGDVVLPALILGQIVSAIDAGILYEMNASADDRHDAVLQAVSRGVASAVATPTIDFSIHHLLRERVWPDTCFRAWSIAFRAKDRTCVSTECKIPSATDVIGSYGSGRRAAKEHHIQWQASEAQGRSRAIFSGFCDAISSGDDPLSGGPPQIAALYTKGAPVQIGVQIADHRYFNGLEVGITPNLKNVEWRNDLGQEINPIYGEVSERARRFLRPSKFVGPK